MHALHYALQLLIIYYCVYNIVRSKVLQTLHAEDTLEHVSFTGSREEEINADCGI
jgi:hypothetical protein